MRWQLTFTTRGGVIFKSTNLNAPQGAGYHDKDRSVEAYQAQAEAVQHRVFCFWNRAPPLGIFQVPRRMLIDVDKFGLTIKWGDRKKGWALKLLRVRKDGHYGHGQKLTVLFAIEPGDPALPANVYGSVEHPQRWIRCVRNIGTSNNTF